MSSSLPLLFTKENQEMELDTQASCPPQPDAPTPPGPSDPSSTHGSPSDEPKQKAVLVLPAPPDPTSDEAAQAPTLEINRPDEGVAGGVFKFDALGPMVVNSDGTLSRITNWAELTEGERERTVRLLVKKRNLVRLASQPSSGSSTPAPSEETPSPSRSQDPAANPANLPPAPTTSEPSQSPYQLASITDAHPHSDATTSQTTPVSDSSEKKEATQTSHGTTVDPHEADQGGTRSIEEKIVDLMKAVEQGEGVVGEGAAQGEDEVKKNGKAASGEEGSEVKIVTSGETDITGLSR